MTRTDWWLWINPISQPIGFQNGVMFWFHIQPDFIRMVNGMVEGPGTGRGLDHQVIVVVQTVQGLKTFGNNILAWCNTCLGISSYKWAAFLGSDACAC